MIRAHADNDLLAAVPKVLGAAATFFACVGVAAAIGGLLYACLAVGCA